MSDPIVEEIRKNREQYAAQVQLRLDGNLQGPS